MSFLARIQLLFALLALSLSPWAASPDELRVAREARMARMAEQIEAAAAAPDVSMQRMATTPCVDGLAGVYPCEKIDLLAFLPLSTIGGGSGNDIWGWTDPQSGSEYALMGRSSGTAFVDVTDPANPVYVGNLPTHTGNSSWRDVKVYADHAYIVSEAFGHGLQVFDLNQLRNVTSPPVTFSETAHYNEFGSAHNIAINEQTGFAYAVGTGTCSGGPHFIDISAPTSPLFAGCHIEAIYTHDTQCVVYTGPDPDHQGKEICINSNENKINIVDVTVKSATSLIATTSYGGFNYVHQGWLTEDQRYYLQGDEGDEPAFGHNTRTRIYDVSDLDQPQLIGVFDGPVNAADHNLYTLGNYVFEANYRAGLQIFDLDDVANGNLSLVASFDTFPSSNSASYSGAWSVYPYFASGTVVVSNIGEGLFVLGPQLDPAFRLKSASPQLDVCSPGSVQSEVEGLSDFGYDGDVTLAVAGLPAGATAGFATNPLQVPGTTELQIDVDGSAAGSYPLALSASDGVIGDEIGLTLRVVDSTPATPTTLAPADGAIDVSLPTTLDWSAAAQATSYVVEVAADPGFAATVLFREIEATELELFGGLDAETTYYWRVRARNGCGTSPVAAASFTTEPIPTILVVDDDDNSPNVADELTDALDALGESYDLWNTQNTDDEPTADVLRPYTTVLWTTGDEFGGNAGPGGGGESALADRLDASACLLITSQDYRADRGITDFMRDYLGVDQASEASLLLSVTGQSIFSDVGSSPLSLPYNNNIDFIEPDVSAEVAFQAPSGSVGILKQTDLYRTSYWGFGFETISSTIKRRDALEDFLLWCRELAALDGDGDGFDNAGDCAPGDPTSWATPGPADGLVLGSDGDDALGWNGPSTPGGTEVGYDVLRSSGATDFIAPGCVETGGTDTAASDPELPAPGSTYYYLVRTRNACGGSLGSNSDDFARGAGECP